jgi:hypothetical protein
MFWTVICLIVDVAIIGRAKQSWYIRMSKSSFVFFFHIPRGPE